MVKKIKFGNVVNRVIRVKIKPGLFLSVFVQKVCLVVIVGFLEVPLSLLRFLEVWYVYLWCVYLPMLCIRGLF